eukprot:Gb_07610 [translate_table: standard]
MYEGNAIPAADYMTDYQTCQRDGECRLTWPCCIHGSILPFNAGMAALHHGNCFWFMNTCPMAVSTIIPLERKRIDKVEQTRQNGEFKGEEMEQLLVVALVELWCSNQKQDQLGTCSEGF